MTQPPSLNPKDNPPSYMMYPAPMGCDLCEAAPDPGMTANGILRRAPMQPGIWKLQPLYGHSIPVIFDTISHTFWTRALEPVMIGSAWSPGTLIKEMNRGPVSTKMRWLHCIRVSVDPTDSSQAAYFILDFMDNHMQYGFRRKLLEERFKMLGVRTHPRPHETYLVPDFPEDVDQDLWAGLQMCNDEWDFDLYHGIVAKQEDSPYIFQNEDHKQRTLCWQTHKFKSIES